MKPTEDDIEMAKAFCERRLSEQSQRLWPEMADLIAEVRTEQRELDVAVCEDYAEATTFTRKAMAAKECARRISEGPTLSSCLGTEEK